MTFLFTSDTSSFGWFRIDFHLSKLSKLKQTHILRVCKSNQHNTGGVSFFFFFLTNEFGRAEPDIVEQAACATKVPVFFCPDCALLIIWANTPLVTFNQDDCSIEVHMGMSEPGNVGLVCTHDGFTQWFMLACETCPCGSVTWQNCWHALDTTTYREEPGHQWCLHDVLSALIGFPNELIIRPLVEDMRWCKFIAKILWLDCRRTKSCIYKLNIISYDQWKMITRYAQTSIETP